MLPTFLVIGAAKAGTTSLYNYLRAHPQVFMSAMKEVEFFVAEEHWDKGLDWYESHFAGVRSEIAVGEASPGYSRYPHFAGVPARIASVLPDVKLVYLLRDPVARMRSQYFASVAGGWETLPLEEALATRRHYLNESRYAFQVEQYLEHFDRSQVLLVRSEDLSADPPATVARIASFIGVDPALVPDELGSRWNTLQDQRSEGRLTKRFHQSALFTRLQRITPSPIRDAAWKALTKPAELDLSQQLSPELRVRLVDELQEDLARLVSLFDEPFDAWGLLADGRAS